MGSIEIVALADLLRLDVNLLDPIYDLFEGSADSIVLPLELSEDAGGSIRNSMLWAANGDLKSSELELHFLMIENLVLVKNLGQGALQIADADVTRQMESEQYHIIKPGHRLISESRILDYKDLWQIYRQLHSLSSIDDYQQRAAQDSSIQHQEYFIERSGSLIGISTKAGEHSIARFFQKGQDWQLEAMYGGDLRLNMLPLQQSVSFGQNSDVISVHGRNYIVEPALGADRDSAFGK